MKRSRIWVFDENRLNEALDGYEQESIDAYPQHEEKIRITIKAMRNYLYSDYADRLTMREEDEK
ncbi:hypothetical protein [Solemya velum gill symbiont]|uniref:hypothetical protein n=1 Tax=Solemya velum gill symbiont TaxID=2340 RepID=UPI000996D723|nr:hypothetical protein [Solemya velum gill symbiont]OOY50972.1 hypothetical protein BOV97_09915 [Solemya velum gill symbiont]OOY55178.1 hypothetical protein BOV99_08710 [Solemya velum gill symbiont]OOY56068.1 hypothetical protein BOW00_08715 [Solemya velum gill symbiont]OOY59536.1 hypothetical protein BOW02_09290 [Solemya velum gill symbiont]OOY60739.1 hypothetical protein BOW04_10700 [Solemya velum gill symbiont]